MPGNCKIVRCTKGKSRKIDGYPGCGRKKVCFLKGTFFGFTRLSVDQVMKLAYEWCIGTKPKQAEQKLGHGSKTITDWYGFFRQMVSSHFKTHGDEKIGSVNVVVQIDESKFAKRRKTHFMHRVGDGL